MNAQQVLHDLSRFFYFLIRYSPKWDNHSTFPSSTNVLYMYITVHLVVPEVKEREKSANDGKTITL